MLRVQLVNFSVVPTYLQIPFCAGVSFVWTVILSMMRGSDTGATVTEDDEAVLPAAAAQPQVAAAAADKPARAPDAAEGSTAATQHAEAAPEAGLTTAHGAVAAAASVAEPMSPFVHGLRQRCGHACGLLGPRLSFASGRAAATDRGSSWAGLAGLLHLQHPLRDARAASLGR